MKKCNLVLLAVFTYLGSSEADLSRGNQTEYSMLPRDGEEDGQLYIEWAVGPSPGFCHLEFSRKG